MKLLDLSIIIVSYNTKDILQECINSIIKNAENLKYEVIVVDNASSDGTAGMLKQLEQRQNIKVILNKENYGFSKANNIGIAASSGEYVLFLNPDTKVYEKTLPGMVDFMKSYKTAGAATCFLELLDGSLDDAAHRGFPTPWRSLCYFLGLSKVFPRVAFFSGYSLSYIPLNKIHEIDACAGAFMIVRRSAGEEVGWWDEDYFWYGEDLDFCYKLKERNWRIYFVPDYKTLHYKGVSGGIKKISKHLSTASENTRKKAIEARFNAMRIFYSKHYKNKYPGFITGIVLSGINLKNIIARYT